MECPDKYSCENKTPACWALPKNHDFKCFKKKTEAPEDRAPQGQAELPGYVPSILFDGYAVFKEADNYDENLCITTEQVSAILDAVVRLIKRGT